MGTNYYVIPTEGEMNRRKEKLIREVTKMEMIPANIERGMRYLSLGEWDNESPWDVFIKDTSIHLGKRSSGWLFSWNFHDDKHYSNKEELLSFIRSNRVVDEYGEEWNIEEFIKMALEWGEPDGKYICKEYFEEQRKLYPSGVFFDHVDYYDKDIDGLRVSRHTEFC